MISAKRLARRQGDVRLFDVNREVLAESARASTRYGAFASSHEALGVLLEEISELKDAVRANDLEAVRREAIQVAAVALRLAVHCRDHADFADRSVPGKAWERPA